MSPGEHTVLCLEPHIDGPRHSGGFFYNDCLAAAGVTHPDSRSRTQSPTQTRTRIPVRPRFSIQAWKGRPLPPAFILLDSLWWYVYKRPLDVLAATLAGRSWGIIMHGLPDEASGLLGDMVEASFVVVPSFWAASQLESVRSSVAAGGRLEVRILYPGWNGRPGLMPGKGDSPHSGTVQLASSSNWTRAKGLVEAACALGELSRNPVCPPWIWQAAGTPDPMLIAEAHSGLGPLASRFQPLGHLDPAALVRLLHGADIFLHPSGRETFCLSVFEAAMAGCRIVARAVGGVPEAVHLAGLLRQELGLPPSGVHLARPGVIPAGETDSLRQALEEALAAEVIVPVRVQAATVQALEHHSDSLAGSRVMKNVGTANSVERKSSTDYGTFAISCETGKCGIVAQQPSSVLHAGLLQEFSWQGRLEKLLLGQSDMPLPALIQPEKVEAS